MFGTGDPDFDAIREELISMNINTLTPIEALMKLQEWNKKFKK